MFKIFRQEMQWGDSKLTLETGKIARQADGAVVVSYGETSVLCTITAAKHAKDGIDFFPLSVHYQDRYAAAGRIPGGFFKREGRPSEKEVLTSRLIDRPIRPLFPSGFYNETQIVCTLLSHDLEHDSDVISIIGSAAALAVSGLPVSDVLSAARVGYKDGVFTLNPTITDIKESELDLVVAGTREGILVVESEAHELSEDTMLDAIMFAHDAYQPVIAMIEALAKDVNKKKWELEDHSDFTKQLFNDIKKSCGTDLRNAYQEQDKQGRVKKLDAINVKVLADLLTPENQLKNYSEVNIMHQLKSVSQEIVRNDVLNKKVRIDGRSPTDIRQIVCEVGLLPRVHGSALFTRGETQALVNVTLGTAQDEQTLDMIHGSESARFMLHYNFPPYSVGEVGRIGGLSRREQGHGKLAWRAINPLIPVKKDFPYTVRVVSEITESNGSSSMATVCGTSLAMMDAGIPLREAVAGIAMGLIKDSDSDNYIVLSDILGDEDHLGDMDFKVAGTTKGITALQMDLKITSIDRAIIKQALAQAQVGRMHILEKMNIALAGSRHEISPFAPRMQSVKIDKEKIRDLIGPGGKVIREICETTKTKIEISEEGIVEISGNSEDAIQAAKDRIDSICGDVEVGTIYKGRVVKVLEFGAIVTLFGDKTGMVHISQLADERVKAVIDVVQEGQEVYVKVIGIEDRGKVKLSMKVLDQTTGEERVSTSSGN